MEEKMLMKSISFIAFSSEYASRLEAFRENSRKDIRI